MSRHAATLHADRITVTGDAADDVGRIALQRLASEKRLPVVVEGPSDYHKGATYEPA